MWKNVTKKMANLSTTKRWLPVPAWRNLLRQNTRDDQVHHHIPPQRLTDRSGMIFLPSTTSTKDPCHGECQRLTKILGHRRSHREDDGAIDWNTCVATTNTRSIGNGRIWNGWIFLTRKDFSFAWMQTVSFCTFEPSKVTLEEPRLILHW